MADNNTLNFDLDAPAVPTLTLDPAPAAAPVEEKKEAPAPAAPEVRLTPEEQAMVDSFAEKIDITNSQQVLQYGSACQKKIGDFSEAALSKVSTKDLGEVGNMITDLIGELKSFDANEEQQKGILGFFKKKGDQLDNLKTKYSKAETNVENIQSMLEGHQVQLLKDIAMLDKMYDLNMAYFKELSMYILAGKKKLAEVRANELQQAMDKAKTSGLPEDAQAARDLADQCERFEKKLYDLELTRNISLHDDFLRNSLVYSHSGSIYVLGSLLLVLAYLTDDGDGGRCPILLDVHVIVLIALYRFCRESLVEDVAAFNHNAPFIIIGSPSQHSIQEKD